MAPGLGKGMASEECAVAFPAFDLFARRRVGLELRLFDIDPPELLFAIAPEGRFAEPVIAAYGHLHGGISQIRCCGSHRRGLFGSADALSQRLASMVMVAFFLPARRAFFASRIAVLTNKRTG